MTSPTRFPCGNVSSYEHAEKDAVGFVPEPALVCGDRIVWKRSGEEILARQVRRIDDSELQRGLRTNFSVRPIAPSGGSGATGIAPWGPRVSPDSAERLRWETRVVSDIHRLTAPTEGQGSSILRPQRLRDAM